MRELRITIEKVNNLDTRIYCVTTEISQHWFHYFERPFQKDSSIYKKSLEEVGEIGIQLLREVFTLPEVKAVLIKPYELTVSKDRSLDYWWNIEPCIIEALKKTFGEKAKKVRAVRGPGRYPPVPKIQLR